MRHTNSLVVLLSIGMVAVFSAHVAGYPRQVTKVLSVSNGGPWGAWHPAKFCPSNSYAVGFNLKVERPIGKGDDTALNAIKLKCRFANGAGWAGEVESGYGPWGIWTGMKTCMNFLNIQFFITSFSLKVERPIGKGDDTAANNMKVTCRPRKHSQTTNLEGNGGPWGGYGGNSGQCPLGSAVCGIQTRVEGRQGRGDDTALNNVKLFCCSD